MKCDRCKKKEAALMNGLCLDCEIRERVTEAVRRVSEKFSAENDRYKKETERIIKELSTGHRVALEKNKAVFDKLLDDQLLVTREKVTALGFAFIALAIGGTVVVVYAAAKGIL